MQRAAYTSDSCGNTCYRSTRPYPVIAPAQCTQHNLWDVSTEDVVQLVIKPLTQHLGCRFVELESQVGAGGGGGSGSSAHSVVGPADAFISHCWQCSFGNLVAAAADNSRPGRKIWVDVFAVNQHATMMADLAGLSDVIRSVPEGLLLVADAKAALNNKFLNPLKVSWGTKQK